MAQASETKPMSVDYLKEIGVMGDSSASGSGYPASTARDVALVAANSQAAASSAAPNVPAEKSAEELAKMTKDERKAYHAARRAAQTAHAPTNAGAVAPVAKQLTKAERRAMQEAQRKAKETKKEARGDNEEVLKELKLQGLTEEQARNVLREMDEAEQFEKENAEDLSDDEPEDFLGSVRTWMRDQPEKVAEDCYRDFNLKVRFQGHVDTTPPDHMRAVMQLIVEDCCSKCDFKAPKLQPTAFAKEMKPLVSRWAPLLETLYGKIPGIPRDAAQVVVNVVKDVVEERGSRGEAPEGATACGLVGCLMAIREIDMVEDEDLLACCEQVEPKSRVVDKFVEFLKEALEDEDDDSDGDD